MTQFLDVRTTTSRSLCINEGTARRDDKTNSEKPPLTWVNVCGNRGEILIVEVVTSGLISAKRERHCIQRFDHRRQSRLTSQARP